MGRTNMEFVNTALSVIIYVPLTILGLFSIAQLYDFIYPRPTGETTIGKQHKEAMDIWKSIEKFFIPLLGSLMQILSNIKNFIGDHLFKIAAIILLTAYFIGSYYFTYAAQSNATLYKYSSITNTIIILLGSFLSIGVFSLFVKENKDERKYPHGTIKRFSWVWQESVPLYKNILAIAITLALTILFIYIINTFSVLSVTLTVVIQIAAILALLFGIFSYVRGKGEWMEKIKEMPLFNFLYHFIFVIPCTVLYLTNFIYTQIKDTPWVVYIILLIEIIAVSLYFLIPMLIRYLYVAGSKKDELTIQQATTGNDMGLLSVENKMTNIMGGLDVDWKMIVEKQLYKQKNEELLKQYLTKQGYESIESPYVKQSFWEKMFKKSLSLEAAMSYVQTNAPLLIESSHDVLLLQNKGTELSKMEKKQSALFKSTILLNEPIYTDTKKDVGAYENLGSDTDIYNYNYGLSSWFFIFERPPSARLANNKFTSILNYGHKPNILFNMNEHKLQIKMNSGIDTEKIIFETSDFPLQTWNNIVINYNGGTLDIFINKKLVSSTDGVVPYMKYDQVTVGEDDGVSGGCCNVVYFSSPLTLSKIELFYDVLKNKNPPII